MKTLITTVISALFSVLLIAPSMAEVHTDTSSESGTIEQNDDGC